MNNLTFESTLPMMVIVVILCLSAARSNKHRGKKFRLAGWMLIWHLFSPQFSLLANLFLFAIGFVISEFGYFFISFMENELQKEKSDKEIRFCCLVTDGNIKERGGLWVTKEGGFSNKIDDSTLLTKEEIEKFIPDWVEKKLTVMVLPLKLANRFLYMHQHGENVIELIKKYPPMLEKIIGGKK